uniref:Uncharacterized protein n=1 Tax=Rhodopseudomonas palustris (strain BisA53) TaxID=316055 RepID=Q07IP7_RHOP5
MPSSRQAIAVLRDLARPVLQQPLSSSHRPGKEGCICSLHFTAWDITGAQQRTVSVAWHRRRSMKVSCSTAVGLNASLRMSRKTTCAGLQCGRMAARSSVDDAVVGRSLDALALEGPLRLVRRRRLSTVACAKCYWPRRLGLALQSAIRSNQSRRAKVRILICTPAIAPSLAAPAVNL